MSFRSRRLWVGAVAVLGLGLTGSSAKAAFTVSGTDSDGRAASAIFSQSGNVITVTLTNTATYDAINPTDILTGVYFTSNAPSAPTATPGTATIAPGSTFTAGTGLSPTDGNVGGEWAIKANFKASNPDGSWNYGISSSGMGVWGQNNRFDTSFNLQGPKSPDGVQWGITTAGDNFATGNGGLSGNGLIKNSVVFTFTAVGFNINNINTVRFQYGTQFSEASIIVDDIVHVTDITTPAPAGLVLLASAAPFALLLRRLRRQPVAA